MSDKSLRIRGQKWPINRLHSISLSLRKAARKILQLPTPMSAIIPYGRSPDQILPWIYLGGITFSDGDLASWVYRNNISHVFSIGGHYLQDLPNFSWPIRHLTYDALDSPTFPLDQHFKSFYLALQHCEYQLQQGKPIKILVHCQAGISRSATMVIYWLMKRYGMSLQESLNYVQRRRPIVNPNIGFLDLLRRYDVAA
jgi:hypothetical protein